MRGVAPDGGEVQLLVREARNGLALQRNSPRPHAAEPAPSRSPSLLLGNWVTYGLAMLTPACGPWVGMLGSCVGSAACYAVGLGLVYWAAGPPSPNPGLPKGCGRFPPSPGGYVSPK